MTASGVLIMTADPSVERLVGEVVDAAVAVDGASGCRTLDELSARLDHEPPAIAVVDIDAAPDELLEALQPIADRHRATKFIAIASRQREEWVHQAMHAGARDFLLKSTLVQTLPGVLDRLIPLAADNGRLGHSVVTILSAGGGCGATTLAVNLAHELHAFSGADTLLIDLDACYGSLATYLGVTAEYSVRDVLADGQRIDGQLLRSTAVSCRDGIHVLVSPASGEAAWSADLNLDHVGLALAAARKAFVHTVVDAPRVSHEVAAELARASALVLLILELNVDDIRIARAQVDALAAAGIPPQRVLAVASRFHRRRSRIGLDEARAALGVERIGRLSNDFARVIASINSGSPLALSAPRCRLRRDIHRLADVIHTARGASAALGRLGE